VINIAAPARDRCESCSPAHSCTCHNCLRQYEGLARVDALAVAGAAALLLRVMQVMAANKSCRASGSHTTPSTSMLPQIESMECRYKDDNSKRCLKLHLTDGAQ
jgi:hypothetical protein